MVVKGGCYTSTYVNIFLFMIFFSPAFIITDFFGLNLLSIVVSLIVSLSILSGLYFMDYFMAYFKNKKDSDIDG